MDSSKPRHSGPGDWRRRKIVQFVREFSRCEGHPPSLREIADAVGLAVTTVYYHVSVLQQDGTLRRGLGKPRTIVEPTEPVPRPDSDDVEIPLIARAGGSGRAPPSRPSCTPRSHLRVARRWT
jgi:SOS-response transcriptional repressor LexA